MVHPLQGGDRAHACIHGQGSLCWSPLSSSPRNVASGRLSCSVRGGHCDSRQCGHQSTHVCYVTHMYDIPFQKSGVDNSLKK